MPAQTHPRPRRPLSAQWLQFDIPAQLDRLQREPEWQSGKRNAITLINQPRVSVVLIALRKGDALHEHQADGTILAHLLKGSVTFDIEGRTLEMAAGGLLLLDGRLRHEVKAQTDSALVLTIAKVPKPLRRKTLPRKDESSKLSGAGYGS